MNESKDRNQEEANCFEFDGYSFDRERCLLSRDAELIPASRKVMETLACLLEGAPDPVSKAQLISRVWPGLVIEETGLHRNISLLRKLLSSQTGKEYLETIPKVGYRFVGEVRRAKTVRNRVPTEVEDHNEAVVIAPEVPALVPSARPSRFRRGATVLVMAVVLVTVVACYSLQPSSKSAHVRTVPVTTRSQERPIVAAAINAEGTQIAYAERDALFIKTIAASKTSEVSLPHDVVPTYVRWAPGNKSLILSATSTQTEKSSIWMLSLAGEPPRELIRNAALASISPDGKHVAFIREWAEIWIADSNGARERRLGHAPGNYRFVYPPQFTANGEFIVDGFHKPADPQTTIETRRLSDGGIVTSSKLPRLQAFTLLGPNALLLSVFSSRGIPPVEIAIQPFDPSRGTVAPMQKLMQWSDATAYKLTASADARRIVLIRDRTQSDVYLADIAKGTRTMENVRRLTFDDASDFPWAWTTDSKRVLFHSLRSDTFHVYEQEYDKTVAHDLVGDSRDSKWPSMTADGRWLFYFSQQYPYSEGSHALTLMRREVGTAKPAHSVAAFTHEDVGLRCAIHADRCVIIDQTSNSSSISTLEASTGKLQHLFDIAEVGRHYQEWSLSPDGQSLALLNNSGIHIYALSNGKLARDINVPGTCALRALTWDPSGNGFYVSKTSGELGQITRVNDDGQETVLYTGPMSAGGWVVPSPDGLHVAFQQWVPSANVWMLEFPAASTRVEEAMASLGKLRM